MSFGAPTSARPAPFSPVNISQVTQDATNFATLGYNLSDADLLSRFPGLVATRNQQINDISAQISGPLDPTVENAFTSSAQSQTLGALGGPTGSVGGKGSAARGAIAANVANQVGQKQDYDWLSLLNTLDAFPERTYTIGPSAALNLLIGNTVGKNQQNFQGYVNQLQQSNAQGQATTSNIFAGLQLAGTVASIIAL